LEVVMEGVSKRFGSFPVLDNISLKLQGKGCYGYLGPNGAGKTTSMKVLTTLLRPDKGSASINGVDVVKSPTNALKSVGSLIEDPEPYPFMTVREFISFAARIRGIADPHVDELKERLDLPELQRKCAKLSKGQKRRVFLGAILAQNPDVLILDEPTAGLDPAESVVFRNLILEAKKEKLVFLSSHLLYEVTQMCEYATFINRGRIVESGRVDDITRRFTSKAIRVEFNGPVQESVLQAIKDQGLSTGFTKENDRVFVVHFDGKEETRKALVDSLFKSGIRSVQDTGLGLEQAYLEITGGGQ
jgi:ABC-2 type transport system ATP-binding protein